MPDTPDTAELFPVPWLSNNLLNDAFVRHKLDEFRQGEADPLEAWLDTHFDSRRFAGMNESQLEGDFVKPLLGELGWLAVPQVTARVQGVLTNIALMRTEDDPDLKALLEQERAKIGAHLQTLNLAFAPDDAQLIKRILLKRCLFGVDLNPFAVELARLSLWMDSFIFGTPLSFIEHHVQQGNALIGASIEDFLEYHREQNQQADLFAGEVGGRFAELTGVMQELNALQDDTPEEIARSKELWQNVIRPRLGILARALDFVCTRRALVAEARLAENALRLTLADGWEDFCEFVPLFDIQQQDVPTTPKACDKLRAENDRIVLRLLGLAPEDMARVLASFRVMREKRPEYLTLLSRDNTI
ncbi:MAG: hypothetical protein LBO00_03200 [Zoogloeaceae bacterium]|jgi:hypothetical protein|nr:hypothetical protein [Zoogloeaceae bacterium]